MSRTTPKREGISNENEIKLFLHCGQCVEEAISKGVSPADYQSIEAGWTPIGLQVWCKRHDKNIIHIDFQGQQLPANTTIKKDDQER
jgi:hypothetical protein